MKNKPFFLLIFIVFYFSGCVSKSSILSTNYEIEKIKLQGIATEIEIIDTRDDVTDREIHLPFLSFPGQKDKVVPVLTNEQKHLVSEQMKSYFSNEGKKYSLKCEIIKGYQEFTAHAFYERQYVQVDTKISLLDTDKNVVQYCTSTAFLEVKSLDATHNNIKEMYEKALKYSVYLCFEKLKP